MKLGFALAILLAMSVQTAMANDIEKVMNKALGSGKGQLLKQAGGLGSKFLKSSSSATPTAATGATPGAPAATPAVPATPAVSAAAHGPAVPATPASPASSNAAASEHPLRDKLMHRAAVESEKYAKKYGDKYLKQGKGQLGKLLN